MQMPLKIVWMINGVQWRVYWQIMQKSWHLRKDIIQTIFLLMTNTKSRLIYNDKFQFSGVYNGQEIIRNEFGRTVATVSYHFNETSRPLERMVFGRKNSLEANSFAGGKNKPRRKYGNSNYMGKTDY